MTRQEIEQCFADAGWDLDGSFAEYLIIGYSGEHVSLLAHKEAWGSDDPVFEILDHQQMLNYWTAEIPTPYQAQKLVSEHGALPETWDQP